MANRSLKCINVYYDFVASQIWIAEQLAGTASANTMYDVINLTTKVVPHDFSHTSHAWILNNQFSKTNY